MTLSSRKPLGPEAALATYTFVAAFDAFVEAALLIFLVVFHLSSSAYGAALLAAALALPAVLMAGLAPKALARFGARNVTSWGGALLVLGAAGLVFAPDSVLLCCIVGAIRTTGRSFASVARSFTVASAISPERRIAANSVFQTAANLGKVIGPLAAAAALSINSWRPLGWCLVFTGLCHVVAAMWLPNGPKTDRTSSPARGGDLRHWGLALSKDRIAAVIVVSMMVAGMIVYVSDDLISLLFRSVGGDGVQLAIAIAVIGVGGMLGSTLSRWVRRTAHHLQLLIAAMSVDAVSFTAFAVLGALAPAGQASPSWALLGVCLVMGVGLGMSGTSYAVTLQERQDPQTYAQSMSYGGATSSAASILFPLIGAALMSKYGAPAPFAVTAVFLWVIVILTFLVVQQQRKNIQEQDNVAVRTGT